MTTPIFSGWQLRLAKMRLQAALTVMTKSARAILHLSTTG